MFTSQKAYMPINSLTQAIVYPQVSGVSLKTISNLLKEFNLPHLIARLNEIDDWSGILSGGEQQKIALIELF